MPDLKNEKPFMVWQEPRGLMFSIGHQAFTIAHTKLPDKQYDPDGYREAKADVDSLQHMLEHALQRLVDGTS